MHTIFKKRRIAMFSSKKRVLSVIVSVAMLISTLFVFNSGAVAASEEKTVYHFLYRLSGR